MSTEIEHQTNVNLSLLEKRFLIEEGKAGAPKMMSVGLHCRLARPGRVQGLAEFLDFVKSYKRDVWVCTREQIADFWIENHAPRGAGSPVKQPGAPEAESDDATVATTTTSATTEAAPTTTEAAATKLEENEPSEGGDII